MREGTMVKFRAAESRLMIGVLVRHKTMKIRQMRSGKSGTVLERQEAKGRQDAKDFLDSRRQGARER